MELTEVSTRSLFARLREAREWAAESRATAKIYLQWCRQASSETYAVHYEGLADGYGHSEQLAIQEVQAIRAELAARP